MWREEEQSMDRMDTARERVGRVAGALREAQARGEVATGFEPESVARFLVASLEGAILVSKLTRDDSMVEQCIGELERYLALYEVRS